MIDIEIIKKLYEWHQQNQACALAVVVETWGSAPRRAGSMLAIDIGGNFAGSVSGGCVEGAVITEAIEMLEKHQPAKLLQFGVADETAWQVGLSCGGNIKIHVVPIGENGLSKTVLENLIKAYKSRKSMVLVNDLTSGEILVSNNFLANEINEHIRKGNSGCVEKNGKTYFIHLHLPSWRLVVVGAVHIAQHLCKMAQSCGFDVLVVDPRTAFATKQRFEGTKLIAEWPQNIIDEMALDEFTALVALSHDPKIDDPALITAIEKKCFYIGALGSKKTHGSRLQRLPQAKNIHAPIGLDIGASSPSEIAVAILAEIIAKIRQAK